MARHVYDILVLLPGAISTMATMRGVFSYLQTCILQRHHRTKQEEEEEENKAASLYTMACS